MMFKLWGRPSSARTEKVMLALAELGIDYELILASATMGPDGSVAKGSKPFGVVDTPQYLAMNPNGTIPTIEDNGYILWESNSIVQYLGMKYDPTLFYGNDTEIFASAARWMMWENNHLISPMHDIVMQTVRLPSENRDILKAEKARAKLIKELKIEKQVVFLDRTDEKLKAALIQNSNLFLMPSIVFKKSVEGFGISFIEAAAYGKASIGGLSGGQPDAVINGKTGYLCDGNDLNEIYHSIIKIFDNENFMGKA